MKKRIKDPTGRSGYTDLEVYEDTLELSMVCRFTSGNQVAAMFSRDEGIEIARAILEMYGVR